jgi:hypothetical protein
MPISASASCSVILARTKVGIQKLTPESQDNQTVILPYKSVEAAESVEA